MRKRWIALIVGAGIVHFVLDRVLGVGSTPALWVTDLATTLCAGMAALACVRTARREHEAHNRIAWYWVGLGTGAWFGASLVWNYHELILGQHAPAPAWIDAPFLFLAPTFAVAMLFYRRQRPSRALQLRQIADLGILTATVALAATLVLAPSLRVATWRPFSFVALGYPGFYLAVVLAALAALARGGWGTRRYVLGILIWANLAFATVALLFGAKAIVEIYQTGIEDTLWILGFLSVCWAAAEERALLAAPPDAGETEVANNALVGAVAVIALAALCGDALLHLQGPEWTVIAIASTLLGTFIALRMWTAARAEEASAAALNEERTRSSRLRAVSSLAGGTAHEVNNLLQAIAGSLALLRRRAARGEDVGSYVGAIESALDRLGTQVDELRKLTPGDGDPTQGMILILPGGDRDGKLAAVLAEAGFAPASLPDLEAAQRAAKGPGVRALVASVEEAAQLAEIGIDLPVIKRSSNILDAVVAVVEACSDS